jgi:hypothetical protein
VLTTVENRVLRTDLADAHTGYRAYARRLLLTVPFLRNSLDFAFDSELITQAAHSSLRIMEVPATCMYFADASSVGFGPGAVYGLETLWRAATPLLHRSGVVGSRKFRGTS